MTTLTDKELIKEIKERIGSLDVRDNIELRAYEIALASLEAEPVGEFYEYKPGDWYQRSVGDKAPKWVPLYATPPVPELQADVAQAIENLKQKLVECNRYNYCADAVKNVEDACRAAMLQGAGGNSPAIPDGWVACSERMPENIPGCYEYLVFETLNNQVNHDYWNVPDKGDDRFNPFCNYYSQHVTHWMPLPAAPQQEISHALAKGMERYGDAMQELAKKEVK